MDDLLTNMIEAAEFQPEFIVMPAWAGHVYFAAWLMRTVKPKIFLELGTHTGTSYFSFCQSVKESNLPCTCFAVDSWKGDEQTGFYGEDIYNQIVAANTRNFHEFSHLIRMTFNEATILFSDNTIDLLHIDGYHTYEAVKRDFENWRSKLSPNAVVCFHDIAVEGDNFGACKYWKDLRKQFPCNLSFQHSNGLGVLSVDTNKKDCPYDWLVPGSREQELVVRFFTALGCKQMEKYGVDKQVCILTDLIHDRDASLCQNEKRLRELQDQATGSTSTLNDHRAHIAELPLYKSRVSDLESKLATLQAELHESQNLRTILEHHISSLRASNSWKITKPLRLIATMIRQTRGSLSRVEKTESEGNNIETSQPPPAESLLTAPSAEKADAFIMDYGDGVGRFFKRNTPIHGLKRFFDYEWDRRISEQMRIRPHCIPSYVDYATFQPLSHPPRIGIHLHLYYTNMIQEFIDRFNTIPCAFDLFVSTRWEANAAAIARQFTANIPRLQNIVVQNVPNRGRDIAPMIVAFGKQLQQYDVIAHFQSKKSVESEVLRHWADCILDSLIGPVDGSGAKAAYILKLLTDNADVVYPALPQFFPRGGVGDSGWGCNEDHARAILEQYSDISMAAYPKIDFVAGSMFWAKAECLEKFLSLPLSWDDFPDEPIPVDGTPAHALERLILVFADEGKGEKIRIHENLERTYVDNLLTAKLYYDTDCGLSEEHSLRPDSCRHDKVIFTLPAHARRAHSFRFDPANHPLTISLNKAVFFGADNQAFSIRSLSSNADRRDGDTYSFYNNWDPGFTIDIECGDDDGIERAQFDCTVHSYGDCDTPGDFTDSRAIQAYIKQDVDLARKFVKNFQAAESNKNNGTVSVVSGPKKGDVEKPIFVAPSPEHGLLSVFDASKFPLILGGGTEWSQRMLNATRIAPAHFDEKIDASTNIIPPMASRKTAIHFHLYHENMLSEAVNRLQSIPLQFDLYISINGDFHAAELVRNIKAALDKANTVSVKKSPNKEGAVDSLVINFGKQLAKYDILANFHSREPRQDENAMPCYDKQLDLLLGPVGSVGDRVFAIMDLAIKHKGVVFPESCPRPWVESENASNGKSGEKLFDVFLDKISPEFNPHGTMFWANAVALTDLLSLPLSWETSPDLIERPCLTLSHVIGCANKQGGGNIRLQSYAFERYLRKDVVFLVGLRGDTPRYRVNNISQGLNELGYATAALDYSQWNRILGIPTDSAPKALVLIRCLDLPAEIVEKVQTLRKAGTKIVCDYDDLLFDPEIVGQSHALNKANITKEVALTYRENLLLSDIGTATTAYLAKCMGKAGVPSFVAPNSLNLVQLAKAAAHKKRDNKEIVIFYGSGTDSHDKDFQQCVNAVVRILDEYPEVRLMLMGSVATPIELRSVEKSVIRKHFAAWRKYADVLGDADINIAPLENITFNQGKSELKIFEASVYGIPTIASPVGSYAECIEDNVDGMLARNDEEWYKAFKRLIEDFDFRRKLGDNARRKAMDEFTYKEAAKIAKQVYNLDE